MHSEHYFVPEESADIIHDTKKNGGRIICVGTTSCRTVESAADEQGFVSAGSGNTEIFIYPGGRKIRATDALITNFHLPESTLIMLVSALAGRRKFLMPTELQLRKNTDFSPLEMRCSFNDFFIE